MSKDRSASAPTRLGLKCTDQFNLPIQFGSKRWEFNLQWPLYFLSLLREEGIPQAQKNPGTFALPLPPLKNTKDERHFLRKSLPKVRWEGLFLVFLGR
nr:hypothetical protein Q903MT_gene4624 [Picea sitchensis]